MIDVWEASETLLAAAERLPQRADQENWAKGVESWTAFFALSSGDLSERWTVDRLADQLAGMKSMSLTASQLQPESSVLVWVNRVHAVICKAGRIEAFRSKALIPNQNGDLKLIGELYRDGGIDPELKDIGDLIGVPVRAELIEPGIDTKQILDLLKEQTEEEIIGQLLDTIRKRFQKDTPDESALTANMGLFAWLIRSGKTARLEGFPALTMPDASGKPAIITLRVGTAPTDRPLCPITCWPESARYFAELLPESVILADGYAAACNEITYWQKLADAGLVHSSPIYENEAVVEQFLPDEPLSDDESEAKLCSVVACWRTEIAWLSKTDKSILNRARGSPNRAVKLLRFCIEYVLPADPRAFEVETVQCENGATHRYYLANWLGPLRDRRWVPVQNANPINPSAESLAALLAGEELLLKRIGEERVSKLLQILGADPAELVLRTLGSSDLERMSLVQSLATIATATGNNAATVQALATAIQNDPAVLGLVQERQARIERVARNQELGAIVEQLFKEVLQSELTVHRKRVGHDFEVAGKTAEEDDAGQLEIVGANNSILVEVKATLGSSVRMSIAQAQTAVLNKDRFFLCVVATTDPALDADIFRAKVRFVPDIGVRLEPLLADFCATQINVALLEKSDGGLTVEISGQNVRFRVDEDVWANGLDFAGAVKLIKARTLPASQ